GPLRRLARRLVPGSVGALGRWAVARDASARAELARPIRADGLGRAEQGAPPIDGRLRRTGPPSRKRRRAAIRSRAHRVEPRAERFRRYVRVARAGALTVR